MLSDPSTSIDWSCYDFGPVILIGAGYEVYDFTQGYDPDRVRHSPFGVGRYDEDRKGMYTSELFTGGRTVHMGIDLAAPCGTSVHAFFDGEVFLAGDNNNEGDYGPTLITRHLLGDKTLYALYGHLSRVSLQRSPPGRRFNKGDVLGWLGGKDENGGWNAHLHFQLSWQAPERPDLPGAVHPSDRAEALALYPDPRLVLGPLY